MPAIAALTINDGAATPVAHTFSPVTTDGAKAQWADRSPSVPAGFRLLSFEMKEPAGNRTAYSAVMTGFHPVVATVDGTDQVVRYNSFTLTVNFGPNSTLQERKDTIAYALNGLSNASVQTALQNLEPFY